MNIIDTRKRFKPEMFDGWEPLELNDLINIVQAINDKKELYINMKGEVTDEFGRPIARVTKKVYL